MENDSLMAVAAPDSAGLMNTVADTVVPEIQMPTAEQLGISIVAGNPDARPLSVMVGDTFDFPVTVSWSVNGSALLVVPTNSATAKGLEQVGVSQESARAVKDGKEIASITFTYKIVAQDTGSLNVPVLKYEIPTQMGTPLTLRTESIPVQVETPANMMPFAVGILVAVAVLVAGFFRARRRAAAKAAVAAQKAAATELQGKMMVLKQRVSAADGRTWLLDLEKVCKEYAAERFMLDAEKVDLKVLVDNEDLVPKDAWSSLVDVFANARYSAGLRDSFENRETWKLAMKLMNLEEE